MNQGLTAQGVLCLALAAWGSSAQAGQLYMLMDNDITIGDDGDYTNGVSFGWESDPYQDTRTLNWLSHQQSRLTMDQSGDTHWGLQLNQRMWTPVDIEPDVPQPDQRPYAGHLEVVSHIGRYNPQQAQKNWFSIGVIGPASGAEQTQRAVHQWTASTEPMGWQYQVENQATVQLGYELDKLLIRRSSWGQHHWDLAAHSVSQLGNFRTDTNLGLTLRWGDQLEQSFGRLSSHFGQYSRTTSGSGSHYQIFVRGQAGFRLNDLTIEGSVPYENQVDVEPLQMGAIAGLGWYGNNWSLEWRMNLYRKEYQQDTKDWHGFGTLVFGWAY